MRPKLAPCPPLAARVFEERASGERWDRPQLHRMLDQLRHGDTVIVWKLDRLPRSLKEPASEILPEIAEQVVHRFMDQQYRQTLYQPVRMLGDKTRRQAAKPTTGRRKIAERLKYLEN